MAVVEDVLVDERDVVGDHAYVGLRPVVPLIVAGVQAGELDIVSVGTCAVGQKVYIVPLAGSVARPVVNVDVDEALVLTLDIDIKSVEVLEIPMESVWLAKLCVPYSICMIFLVSYNFICTLAVPDPVKLPHVSNSMVNTRLGDEPVVT